MDSADFDGHNFDVELDGDGRLPAPVPDEDLLFTYECTAWFMNSTRYFAVLALHSKVTIIPAMGSGGLIITERGEGSKHLTFPVGDATMEVQHAILTGFTGYPRNVNNDAWKADLTFILAGVVS